MAESQLERALKRRFQEMMPEYEDRTTAITGYVSPTTGIVDPNPLVGLSGTGMIWIHSEDGRSSTPAIIGPGLFNLTIAAGIRIKTGINSKGERVAIEFVPDGQNAPIIQQYHNAAQQAVYVDSRQFTAGLVTAWSAETGGDYGLFVYVHPFTYADKEPHGAVDVSASVPGSTGERRQTVISYRVSTDEFLVTDGAPSTLPANAWTKADAVAIALPFADCIRLGAVILENGQTTITESDLFFDCRDWLTLTGIGVQSVVAGTNVTVDNTDPQNPIVSSSGGGGSLTSTDATLAADVTMTTANTYYDAVSVSLAAGTWLISANAEATCAANSTDFTAQIWDGASAVYASAQSVRSGASASLAALMSITPRKVVLSGTTTVKLSVAGNNNTCLIRAAAQVNGVGNNATFMTALQIA